MNSSIESSDQVEALAAMQSFLLKSKGKISLPLLSANWCIRCPTSEYNPNAYNVG